MSSHAEVWSIDTEWGYRAGRIDQESTWEPVVLCVVGLHTGRRLAFWGRDPGLPAFFRAHADDLFVAHYAIAEMKYLLQLGIPLPPCWFDTFLAWRHATNQPGNLDAGLVDALVRLGKPGLAPAVKEALRRKILHMQFDFDSAADRHEISQYCFSDCDGCAALFPRLHDRVKAPVMTHWVDYLKAVARMELRGIPFDVNCYGRIQAMRPMIRAELIGNVNATWPVFEGTTFKRKAFLSWCRSVGIAWPTAISSTTGKPYHSVDNKTLKDMESRHPFIALVRQLRKTIKQLDKRKLAVDPVLARHFYSTSVFRSVTGRNQPRNFIFGAPKWMRYLFVPESPEHVLAYVDYIAQEVGIAAALSGDQAMRAIYEADDCHMAFAIRAGAAPFGATKGTHADIRRAYKTVNLGMQYGQTAHGIAARLGIPLAAAETLVAAHRTTFPDFWRWSERMVQGAYDRGSIQTACGWRSKVPFNTNERTWMNWPIQAAGADIMRLTITYLDRQNVRVLAPVHDGFLLSCRRDQLNDLRGAVDYACRTAVEHVLPGFHLRWDVAVYGDKFTDEDGAALWHQLQRIMEQTDGNIA